MQPTEFFACLGPDNNQDATGIFDVMINAFHKYDLSPLLQKIFFLSSDGALVNSGQMSGSISLLRIDREWVTFTFILVTV